MTGDDTARPLADRVKAALESGDLDAISPLLDPDVRWGGPEVSEWDCKNRSQVLEWWGKSQQAGVRAVVTEILGDDKRLVVGLRVSGRRAEDAGDEGSEGSEGSEAPEAGDDGEESRWQVLTLKDGLVADIRGFDDRDEALLRAGLA